MQKKERALIYFVTSNRHKFEEISLIVREEAPWIRIDIANDVKKLEIQADSLEEIALYAAETILRSLDAPFIVEEAGLFIRRLGGFPGPYSSYVYRTIGCEGILKLMDGVEDRHAEFRSIIVLCYGGLMKVFKGSVRGHISSKPRGSRGFGFDPIFVPEGDTRTFAEMGISEKNRISHRAQATRRMLCFLREILL